MRHTGGSEQEQEAAATREAGLTNWLRKSESPLHSASVIWTAIGGAIFMAVTVGSQYASAQDRLHAVESRLDTAEPRIHATEQSASEDSKTLARIETDVSWIKRALQGRLPLAP